MDDIFDKLEMIDEGAGIYDQQSYYEGKNCVSNSKDPASC
jgi:hypothetical protein